MYMHTSYCTNLLIVGTGIGSDSVKVSDGISGSWSRSVSCIVEDSGVHFSAGPLHVVSDVTDPISSSS